MTANQDENFPGRPDHPDFWLIARAVRENDARADAGAKVADILKDMADPDSVFYVAFQRGLRAVNSFSALRSRDEAIARLAGVWTDGFAAGMKAQQARSTVSQDGS